jgi:hypothetical protein
MKVPNGPTQRADRLHWLRRPDAESPQING